MSGKMLRLSAEEYAERAARPLLLKPSPVPEGAVLSAVLKALQTHRRVGWVHRFNTGAGKFLYPDGTTSQFIVFGFPGQSDILGQLVTGEFLAVEVKSPGARTDPRRLADQTAFIERVRHHGGVGFFASGVDDVIRELGSK